MTFIDLDIRHEWVVILGQCVLVCRKSIVAAARVMPASSTLVLTDVDRRGQTLPAAKIMEPADTTRGYWAAAVIALVSQPGRVKALLGSWAVPLTLCCIQSRLC